jgi:hypothetical protein
MRKTVAFLFYALQKLFGLAALAVHNKIKQPRHSNDINLYKKPELKQWLVTRSVIEIHKNTI